MTVAGAYALRPWERWGPGVSGVCRILRDIPRGSLYLQVGKSQLYVQDEPAFPDSASLLRNGKIRQVPT